MLQGESLQAAACIPVGECWIEGLPPNLPKGSRVEVTCGITANGLIQVTAKDLTSGRTARADLHRSSGLEDDAIAREAEFVKSLKIQ